MLMAMPALTGSKSHSQKCCSWNDYAVPPTSQFLIPQHYYLISLHILSHLRQNTTRPHFALSLSISLLLHFIASLL